MKMHGLGNDFVVIDTRDGGPDPARVDAALARAMADRHRGIGFDQLALIRDGAEGLHLDFWNADGSRSAACGNATRCIAAREMARTGATTLAIATDHGTLQARSEGAEVAVNMGPPETRWDRIPLSREVETDALPLEGAPVATSMGNPHCTFFVPDAEAVDLAELGPRIEHDPLFPQRTNVQVASVIGPDRLRMRVWERGTGITLASGSSSCATAVAAHRRGLTGRAVTIVLDGGTLRIDWRADGVWMTGPTAHVFDGVWHG
ncbi:diaminopimelate epimerase [Wenxinia saemankumensis]|nr:diaminopimelate epimerase [Wenxinia saemankumensis]